VVFSGEGEPTLHPGLQEVANLLDRRGKKVGVMSNGTRKEIVKLVQFSSWIRFSVNAASSEMYHKIHQRNDREVVWENIEETIERRRHLKSGCTLGVQCLLLPDNRDEIRDLAWKCLNAGLDYLVVKPFSQHPQACNKPQMAATLTPGEIRSFEACSTADFTAVYRHHAFSCVMKKKPYPHCLAAPFFHLILATQEVYPCAQFAGISEFCLGSFKYQSLSEIIHSERRKGLMYKLREKLPVRACRHPCRLDAANRYLYSLLNTEDHDAFV
jgi:MoaA/NifB/PqqE/SkfB family radical SAM enzyme